jgi:hypothetical protein
VGLAINVLGIREGPDETNLTDDFFLVDDGEIEVWCREVDNCSGALGVIDVDEW